MVLKYVSLETGKRIFFSQEGEVVNCNDISALMNTFGHEHKPEDWRLFIYSSKVSLKAVPLHNGNEFPSAHVENMKETCGNMKLI
jgi:hypothetical protein